jgi:hypothetical protein
VAASDYPGQALTLTVHSSIRDLILDEGSALEDLERRLGRPIAIKSDEALHVEAYRINPADQAGPA